MNPLLTFNSLWYYPAHGCLLPLHAAIHSRELCPPTLEDALHHRHDRPGYPTFPHLRSLREVPRPGAFPAVEVPQGAYHRWLLSALWRHVSFSLLLERDVQFVSAGRA